MVIRATKRPDDREVGGILYDLATQANTQANGVVGVASGYKIARGSIALDGSNPTDITTGLTSIDSAVVTIRGSSAPGDNTSVLTTAVSGGTLSVYAWKNTSGTDPTLVASTSTETIDWIAIGA
jgi:hypothetical protein